MNKKLEFETALQRLEEIVKALESGELSLATSLELFEEGIKLSHFCHSKLDEAERKVEVLVKRADGSMEAQPFESAEGEAQE